MNSLKHNKWGMEAYSIVQSNGKTIKEIFDFYFKNMVFDRNFIRKVVRTAIEFETKNEEHINFLGSNLLGVYRIKYLPSDEDKWIDEVLDLADWGLLEDEVHDLDSINKDYKVAGSVLNMSYVYVAHRIMNCSDLSEDEIFKGAVACFKLFHYKFLASFYNYSFPFKTQEGIALALYEALSRKSLLKRYHTWGKLVEARSIDSVSSSGIHYKTLMTMNNDKSVLYVITDTQSRIREVVKKLNRAYRQLRDADARVISDSKFSIKDGEMTLKDFKNETGSTIREVVLLMHDRRSYIRDELVEQTLTLIPTADKRYLIIALEAQCKASSILDEEDKLKTAVESLVVYIQDYQRKSSKVDGNMVNMVVKLRNMYRSSQLTNTDIMHTRDVLSAIVDKALEGKSKGVISATRIAVIMYLTLRIFTIKHYH